MNIEVFCGVLYRACTCRESYEKVITSNFLRNKNQRNDSVFLRNKNEIDAVRNAEVVVVHHVVEEVHQHKNLQEANISYLLDQIDSFCLWN